MTAVTATNPVVLAKATKTSKPAKSTNPRAPVKPIKVWRIATENKKYFATDLGGKGAALSPGRWNELGLPMLYTATTVALATLETVAHINARGIPQMKYLISVKIDALSWMQREVLEPKDLPPRWDAIPHEAMTSVIGSDWLKQCRSLILCVPSAIAPEETVVLINPLHPSAATLVAEKIRLVDYKTVLRS
jgi:RES domain-containing protein